MIFLLYTGTSALIIFLTSSEQRNIVQLCTRSPLGRKNPPYSFERAPRSTSKISKLCPNPFFLLDILETVMNTTSKYFMLHIEQQLCNSKTIDWTLIQPQRNHFHHQPIRFMAAQLWKSTCRLVSLEWIYFSEQGENELD